MADSGRDGNFVPSSRYQAESCYGFSGQWYYRDQEGRVFLAEAPPSPDQHGTGESTRHHSTASGGSDPRLMYPSSTVPNNGSVNSSTSRHSFLASDDPTTTRWHSRVNYNQDASGAWSMQQYMAYSPNSSDANNSIDLVDQYISQYNTLSRHGDCPMDIEVSDDAEGNESYDIQYRLGADRTSKSKSKPSSAVKSGSSSGSRSSKSGSKSSKSSKSSESGSRSSGSGSKTGSKRFKSR